MPWHKLEFPGPVIEVAGLGWKKWKPEDAQMEMKRVLFACVDSGNNIEAMLSTWNNIANNGFNQNSITFFIVLDVKQ